MPASTPELPELPEDLLQQLRADLVRAWPALQGGAVDVGPFTDLTEAVCAFARAAKALGLLPERVLAALHRQVEIVTRGELRPGPFANAVRLLGVHAIAQCYPQSYRDEPLRA
jgi:hypothetical protein